MHFLYMDPIVLAFKFTNSVNKSDFYEYVENLSLCLELNDDISWINVLTSKESENILFKTSSYPLWADLNHIIKILEINDIQPKDINYIIQGILKRTKKIENFSSISDILMNNIKCDSCYNEKLIDDIFKEHFHKILFYIVLCKRIHSLKNENQIFFSKYLDSAKYVNIEGVLLTIEPSNDKIKVPEVLVDRIKICNNQFSLYNNLDTNSMWSKSNDLNSFYKTIEIYLFQNKSSMIRNYKFGKNFLYTVQNLGFNFDEKKIKALLKCIMDLLTNVNLSSTHPLRINSAGNSPQIIRNIDNALAWRKDIGYDYHLHYWSSSNKIELADVVIHNDSHITE